VRYMLADTRRPIRGVTFTPKLLRQLAESARPGPLFREHRDQVIGRTLKTWTATDQDGATELWGEAEIDVPAGADLESYAGRGASMSFLARYEGAPSDPVLTVGAEPGQFSDHQLESAQVALDELMPGGRVYVTRYYQFAELPPPTIIIEVAQGLLVIIEQVGIGLIVMGIAQVVAEHFARSKTTEVPPVVRVGSRRRKEGAGVTLTGAREQDVELVAAAIRRVLAELPADTNDGTATMRQTRPTRRPSEARRGRNANGKKRRK
jgi:hypothetical protein